MSVLPEHSTSTEIEMEFPSDALAEEAKGRMAGLGIEAARIGVEHTPEGEPSVPEGNEPWDATVMSRMFRRWVAGGVIGVAVAEALLMLGIGIAKLVGADTTPWAASAAIAAFVGGFMVSAFGNAMLALPSVEQINAGPAGLPAHTRVVVRLGAHDSERRVVGLLREAAHARVQAETPQASPRRAA